MEASFFLPSAIALLASNSAFATPTPLNHDRDEHRCGPVVVVTAPQERACWGNERRNNYGYDRNHRVTPQEHERWEATQRYNDHR